MGKSTYDSLVIAIVFILFFVIAIGFRGLLDNTRIIKNQNIIIELLRKNEY